MAEVLHIHPKNPQLRFINKAVEVLRSGGVIIYPTDTVYGLGCDIFHKKAIERIYQIKPFLKDKPLSFICADLKDIANYAKVSTQVYRFLKYAFPGPYTFILPAAREVPKKLWSKRKTVGIRVPDNLIAQTLAKELGHPIVSTSVTDENGEILNDEESIIKHYGKVVDLILYSGPLSTLPSTIIDFSGEEPEIVREGAGEIDFLEVREEE
jgi:tRNA threonylcarbamoyl adenosine modification protein (Sua5/YciO/YrdC/YwlC family)